MSTIKNNHKYRLRNLMVGTYLSIGDDGVSIVAKEYTDNPAGQVWIFQASSAKKTFLIKSLHGDKYIATQGTAESAELLALPTPCLWQAQDVKEMWGVPVFCPVENPGMFIDVRNANSEPGNLVQLWHRTNNNQTWILEEVKDVGEAPQK